MAPAMKDPKSTEGDLRSVQLTAQTERVAPAQGHQLLQKLFKSKVLPIVNEPADKPLAQDNLGAVEPMWLGQGKQTIKLGVRMEQSISKMRGSHSCQIGSHEWYQSRCRESKIKNCPNDSTLSLCVKKAGLSEEHTSWCRVGDTCPLGPK